MYEIAKTRAAQVAFAVDFLSIFTDMEIPAILITISALIYAYIQLRKEKAAKEK